MKKTGGMLCMVNVRRDVGKTWRVVALQPWN